MFYIQFERRQGLTLSYPSGSMVPHQFTTIEDAQAFLNTLPGFHKNPNNYHISIQRGGLYYSLREEEE